MKLTISAYIEFGTKKHFKEIQIFVKLGEKEGIASKIKKYCKAERNVSKM